MEREVELERRSKKRAKGPSTRARRGTHKNATATTDKSSEPEIIDLVDD